MLQVNQFSLNPPPIIIVICIYNDLNRIVDFYRQKNTE